MLTDGQNMGWEIDHPARWEALAQGSDAEIEAEDDRPAVSAAGVVAQRGGFEREVFPPGYRDRSSGWDRSLDHEYRNRSGDAGRTRTAHGRQGPDEFVVSQLGPGVTEKVRFTHHFEKPGGYVVTAGVQVEDELSPATCGRRHRGQGTIACVDHRWPSCGEFLERAGSFAALALAPGSLSRSPVQTENTKSATADLIDPEVRPVAQLSTLSGFGGYDAVILCDVPALAPSTARLLADFVGSGGGAILAPGPRAKVSFYNDWRASDGRAMLPVPMIDPAVVAEGSE